MTSLALIGECMMELNAIDTLNFKRSFGGDTYNTAVYAKRWQPNIHVYYLSAIGTDTLSNEMLTQWKAEDLNTDYVLTSDTAQLGIYAITNESGVRDVSYWRKDSAAIQIMKLLEEKGGIEFLPKFDYLYFTGISLGILSDVDKEKLLDLIKQMKKQGTVIAFDPNYRKKLWSSIEEAARWITKAYEICDIAFPGVGDHKAIFGHLDHKEVYAYITHPVLSGPAIENIENSTLDTLIVTDTIPLSDKAKKCGKIRPLTISGLIAESIRRISNEESISALFD